MIEKLIDSLDGEIKTQEYFYLVHLLEIFQDCKVHHEANQTMLESLFIGWFAAEQLDPSIRTLLGVELLSAYRHVNQAWFYPNYFNFSSKQFTTWKDLRPKYEKFFELFQNKK